MLEEMRCECSKGSFTPALTLISYLERVPPSSLPSDFDKPNSSLVSLCNFLPSEIQFKFSPLPQVSLLLTGGSLLMVIVLILSYSLVLVCFSKFLSAEADRPTTASSETKVRAWNLRAASHALSSLCPAFQHSDCTLVTWHLEGWERACKEQWQYRQRDP